MKIHSLMIPDPITVSEKANIEEAIALMKKNTIRHLPVVSKTSKLKGLVTLSDLRQYLIPSMLEEIAMTDVMIKHPITVGPDEDVETAAQLIYKHKISGIPVVQKNSLVGIITETDILRTFINMMGILTESSRIDVVLDTEPKAFQMAMGIINENGGEIINIGMTAEHNGKRVYYFRLKPCKTDMIRKALEIHDFRVLEVMD
ncbi:MAG: CBS domain-containing protein [Desulfobacteraceae bacterium]|nr:CBS domain-containing protein [Desulfobacteraceae bacterium]MBU4053446.1 CBS domain-containing protein [Pseudomonadota bacterium]